MYFRQTGDPDLTDFSTMGKTMYLNLGFDQRQQPCAALLCHHFRMGVFSQMRGSGPPPDLKEFDDDDLMEFPNYLVDQNDTEYLDLTMKARLQTYCRPNYIFDEDSDATGSIDLD